MLIGIFGGTFDPVHEGHKGAVDDLCDAIAMDQLYWVLSARPPHKDSVSASVEHRFKMLQLALMGTPNYLADDTEIRRQKKSYTIDTVKAFRARFPSAHLCVVIGGDSLHSLHSWRQYDELMRTVNWVVMHRPGYRLEVPSDLQARLVESPAELLSHASGKIWVFSQTHYDVSSTELRLALSSRDDAVDLPEIVRKFLDPEVLQYILTNRLYLPHEVDPKRYTNRLTATESNMNSEQIKDQVVAALEDVKGQDIKVIDIADISDFADFMVVASGTSDTHVKALARSASDKLRGQNVKPLNEDGADVGEWVLVDFGDVVLHVMRPEVRAYYDLERLWDEDVRKMVEQHREERGD